MRKTVLAAALTLLSAAVMADAPTPVAPATQDQLRVSHARDWREAAQTLAQAVSESPALKGKSISLSVESETPFLKGFTSFLAPALQAKGFTVLPASGEAVLTVGTQFVDHSPKTGYDAFAPVTGTVSAVGAVTLNEVLRHLASFNGAVLTLGVAADALRYASKDTALEEIILTAQSPAGYSYAESFYAMQPEAHLYRDNGLRSATLRVLPQ